MTCRPAGVLLISLPAAERSEEDPEGNKALLIREKGDFTCLNTSFICLRFLVSTCVAVPAALERNRTLFFFHPPLVFPSKITILYMFMLTKDCLPLQICHLRLKRSFICMHFRKE